MEYFSKKIAVLLKLLPLIFLWFTIQLTSGLAQNFSTVSRTASDTSFMILHSHGLSLRPIILDSSFFSKKITKSHLNIELKPDLTHRKYYDIKNVIPENPMMLDYRGSSYYTPKIVQDRLTFFMNRPPADSFVSIPTIAILAARIAMNYVDIETTMRIKAEDYLVEEKHLSILYSLWRKSPLTIREVYAQKPHSDNNTFETLSTEFNYLIEKRLIKRREMENGETLFYPAQICSEVILLLDNYLTNGMPTPDKRLQASDLCTRLKNL